MPVPYFCICSTQLTIVHTCFILEKKNCPFWQLGSSIQRTEPARSLAACPIFWMGCVDLPGVSGMGPCTESQSCMQVLAYWIWVCTAGPNLVCWLCCGHALALAQSDLACWSWSHVVGMPGLPELRVGSEATHHVQPYALVPRLYAESGMACGLWSHILDLGPCARLDLAPQI